MGRPIKWSEKKIEQLEKEGRGKGEGATYIPWLQVFDFPSKGNSRRVFSRLTNRVHHLFSDIEWHAFLLMEFAHDVKDIREQYPLPRKETLEIAARLGIKHPTYPGTRVPAVMTSDFLVKRATRDSRGRLEAYNCKSSGEAEEFRSLEKLEIQRAYFDGCGVPHHLLFDSLLPKNKIRALNWIRSANEAPGEVQPHEGFFQLHKERICHELARGNFSGSLVQYCTAYDARTGSAEGVCMRIVRMLLEERRVKTDLNQPNLPEAPVAMFVVNDDARCDIRRAG